MFHSQNVQRLAKVSEGALVIVTGYDAMQLSGDMQAPFLQEANFWWLTGVEEPGWKVIIDTARHKTTLVSPELSDTQQLFNGGVNAAKALAISGASAVIPANQFEAELQQLARVHPRVLTVFGVAYDEFRVNPALSHLKAQLERHFERVEACDKTLASLRAIKQPAEIQRIKKAIKLTTQAFSKIREQWQDYAHEYEIEADFSQSFRRQNATHAYAPIVAAGVRACTLHYDKNGGAIRRADGVVIDIGARLQGYAADITRTYSLAPSPRLRDVHAAVQRAQAAIIALLEPGLAISDYSARVDTIMKDEMLGLGLLRDVNDNDSYRRYFPHAISHGLGVDVHDSLGGPRYLEPGMVLTVEPGVYIPEESIGVRIEDDILITEAGHQNLSRALSTDL